MRRRAALAFLLLALVAPLPARAQAANDPEHAKALIEAAITALGGEKYLGVTSSVSTGIYTPFVQGRAGFPIEFVDTYVFPDKDRTDFGKKKTRVIQANAGDRGWKYDGAREILSAQEPEEIRAFQRYVRANIDNLFRRTWREPGVVLRYLGRAEIAPRVWTEGAAVDFPDGFSVEIFFDLPTHLPRVSRYHEGAESGAAGSLVETRYHDVYLDFGGVKTPRTIDLYRDKVQTARLVYEDVKFNVPVDPKTFEQPASAKDIK